MIRITWSLGWVTLKCWPVFSQAQLIRVAKLGLFDKDVAGDIDKNRPRPALLGNMESFLDHGGYVLGSHHHIVMLGNGQGDTGDVYLLKGVLADERPCYLACDSHHGGGVEIGGSDSGD